MIDSGRSRPCGQIIAGVLRVFAASGIAVLLVASVGLAEEIPDALTRKLTEFPGAERGQIIPITDAAVARTFPGDLFYVLRFRQYPVAIEPPEPLRTNNLFVVKADGSVEHLRDTGALEHLFRVALPAVRTEAQAKEAVKVWLRLGQEFHQDGFFQFSIPDDAVTIVAAARGGYQVTGKAIVNPQGGNAGKIAASLTFDAAGRLAKASETVNLKRGIRPICQATWLLHPDPAVRARAEQDLLAIGKAAKEYLDEQRARAAPELQRAIDRIWQRILTEDR